RYLSPPEAAWRIFCYPIIISDPLVLILPIHLPNANISQYTHSKNILLSVSLLDHYLLHAFDFCFTQLKYTEYYENDILYPFNSNNIYETNFIEQEHSNVQKNYTKMNYKKFYNIYQEVACEIGLFANESKSILIIKEAIDNFYTPAQLRFLFTQLVLDDFGLSEPYSWTQEVTAELQHYSNYEKYEQLAKQFYSTMNSEQTTFYKEVVNYILNKQENNSIPISKFLKFLNRKAGQGKTFLIIAICYKIQASKKIILICGTTALLALYMKYGLLLQEICKKDELFGEKPFIGLDDFRQVAPVIKGASITTPDYLTKLIYSGIPNHEIHLKVGAICSIMQNISIDKGL
ncbi:19814_t:CDS:2, partial [Gigaspora margarita]